MVLPRRPELHAATRQARLHRWLLCLLLPFSACASMCAQDAISGALTGRVPPGATVTLESAETGERTSTLADRDGRFLLTQLTPGPYLFSTFLFGTPRPVTILPGETTVLRPSAAPPAPDDPTPANPDEDGDGLLSFRGLSPSENATLLDGVSADQSFGGVPRGTAPAVLDPDLDDEPQAAGLGRGRPHGAPYSFSQAAVRATHVSGQGEIAYTALTGNAAGGIVATVSRGGSDKLHGGLFYDVRSSALAAANPLSIATSYTDGVVTAGPVKPHDLRQVVGGTLGGPIPRLPRLLFFYTLDRQIREYPAISSPQDPNFYRLTATQLALLANRGVGTAATYNGLNYLSSLTGTLARSSGQTINFIRLDALPVHGQRLGVEWNRVRWSSPAGLTSAPVVARARASFGNSQGSLDTVLLRLTSTLKPNLTNELRLQFARDLQYELPQTSLPQEPTIGPGGQAPEVSIGPNGLLFGTPAGLTRSAYPDERRLQAAETITWRFGRHLLQAGVDFSAVHDLTSSDPNPAGTFTYDSGVTGGHAGGLVDWITDSTFNVNAYPNGGCPSISAATHDFCFRTFTQGFGTQTVSFATEEWAAFAQESWRIRSGLTLNAGLRYEYQLLPLPQQPNAALDAVFGSVGATSVFPEDRNNLGPRVGLAWEPFGDGRGTLRAGYGAYFGRLPGATIAAALTDTALAASTTRVRITPTTITGCPQVANQGFGYVCDYLSTPPAAVAQTTSAILFDRSFRLPVVQQASLALERELGRESIVSATYVVNLDRQLPGSTDLNIAASPAYALFQLQGGTGAPGARDGETFSVPIYTSRVTASFGPVTQIASHVSATYHGLTLAGRSHPLRSLNVDARYTWSRAIDFGQAGSAIPATDGQFDPFNNRYDKAASALNYPHSFAVSALWQPKFALQRKRLREAANGWLLTPRLTARSGRPYSLQLFGGTRLSGGHESLNGSGGAVYLPTVGRDTLRLPPVVNLDLRVGRELPLPRSTARAHLHLRGFAEALNLTNHNNITSVNQRAYLVGTEANGITPLVFQSAAAIASEGLNTQPFGTPIASGSSTARARQIQLGLRLEF